MTTRLTRTTFQTSRLLDYVERKELVAQTGHEPRFWPLVVLKELIDNALDACEDAGIAPEVGVTVRPDSIQVADNGPGLPPDTIDGVLDFSIRVSSREAYVAPDRGAQGNALKTIVAMPFVLDGQKGQVEIEAQGTHHTIRLAVDRIRQEPRVHHEKHAVPTRASGTRVTVQWPDSASSRLPPLEARFLQVAEAYTVLNPHLTLSLDWFGTTRSIPATAPNWTKWRPAYPTSPHWYTPAHLARLISAYLSHDAVHGRPRTVRELVSEFRGLSGTGKQKAILEATGLLRAPLTSLVRGEDLDAKKVTALLTAMQRASKVVPPALLGVLGKEHVRTRVAAYGADLDTFEYRCHKDLTAGLPAVVETAFAWCPPTTGAPPRGRRLIAAGVNWSPGLVNPFRSIGKIGENLDAKLEQARAGMDSDVVLVIHLAHPRVEYADRGKSAVHVEDAEVEPVTDEGDEEVEA